MPRPITLVSLDHPRLRGPEISIRHYPAFGIAAKVVRCERRDFTSLCFILHDTPNDLRAESIAPNPASLIDRTKKRAGCNPGGCHPDINSSFHPVRNRDGSYVAALADKIGDDPMLLSLLYVFNAQCSQFRSAETATQQNGQRGVVSLTSKAPTVCRQQQALALFGTEPIANGHSQPFCALYPANSSGQVCAEQAAISSLVGEPPDCSQTQVYGGRRVVPLFKGYAVSGDHGLVESEPGL